MTLTKYISIRLLALACLALVFNEVYRRWFYAADIHAHSDTLENLLSVQDSADILYFGESSNFYQEHPDSPNLRISEHLDNLLGSKAKVMHVDNSGLTASTYYHLMQNLPADKPNQRIIIVTMNLRSFGYDWILGGNYNYLNKADELIKMRPALYNRLMITLKHYPHMTESELKDERNRHMTEDILHFPFPFKFNNATHWNNHMSYAGWLTPDSSWDMPKINLASSYIKVFAFEIDTASNERIKDFDKIVQFAKTRNYRLVFNILAENLTEAEAIEKRFGKGLVYLMKRNRDLLVKRYLSPSVLVVDNLEKVEDVNFRDRGFPTEHYNITGKKAVAKTVCDSLVNRGWVSEKNQR